MRLIDADTLERWLEMNYANANPLDYLTKATLAECLAKVKASPTIDAVPVVHGRWQGEADGYADGYPVYDVWYCSECGYCVDDGTDDPALLPRHCPDCGAKMKEDAEK